MFRKWFSFTQKEDDQVEDITNLGPANDIKLKKLKNYIIKKDFESFQDFTNYYIKNSPHSQCTVSWNHRTIACRCKQCQMASNSCVCIRCFLEGPHKYHSYAIHITNSGNCDCGDPSGWKPEGYCKRHRFHQNKNQTTLENQSINKNSAIDVTDNDDDENYIVPDYRIRDNINQNDEKYVNLSPELKESLLTVFKIARKDIEEMIDRKNFRYFTEYCHFFMEFATLGDEIRNCVCEVLNDADFLKSLILETQNLDKQKTMDFFQLSGALYSDPSYSIPFTHAASQAIPELLDVLSRNAILPFANRNDIPIAGIESVFQFDFQYFSVYPIKVLVSQDKFNWIGIILKFNDIVADFVLHEENIFSLTNFESVFSSLYSYFYILRVVFHIESEKPKFKQFMIDFSKSLARFEGFVPTHMHDRSQIYDTFEFLLNLAKLPYKLMKNIPYFIPEINDIFIYYLLNKKPADENKMKNYSLAVIFHQIFIKNLLLFNRKNEYKYTKTTITSTPQSNNDHKDNDDLEDSNNDIRKIIFDDCYNGKDPQDTFEHYCIQNLLKKEMIRISQISNNEYTKKLINNIYMDAIDLPMTLIAAHFLLHFQQNPITMPTYCFECVTRVHSHSFFLSYILPNLLSLVQVMFSFADKKLKDDMLKKISTYFGATDSQYNESSRKMRDFSFIIFLSSLILDRDGINSDYKNISIKNLMTNMKYTNVGQTEIPQIISPCSMSTNGFKEKYESIDIENDWNIVIPYYNKIQNLYDSVLPAIIEKTQDTILPFPEFDDPNICDDKNKLNTCPNLLIKRLPEVFESKYIFAIIYYFIYEYNSDQIITQYALNLFITFAENSKVDDNNDNTNNQPIIARSLDDLVANIPTNNFRTFAKTKVNFKGNQGYSLVQLVNDLGLIGLSALRRIGMSITNVKKSKKKIIKLKKTLSRSLINSSHKFEATIDRKSHDCCSICHKVLGPSNAKNPIQGKFDSEMLYIPVSLFKSVSTELVDDFIHGKLQNKSQSSTYTPKNFIRRHPKYKYVHLNCFMNSPNFSVYYLMPKIDQIPFNILAEEKSENTEENDSKSLIPVSKTSSNNTLEISTSNNNHNGLNLNINFNLGNIRINGVPLNLNNNFNNNPHRNINININNNDDDDNNPFRLIQNIVRKSSSSFSSLINNDNDNRNDKNIQSFLLNSIFDFLSKNNLYSNSLEVLNQMILVLDHRSRLIPEILDNPMVTTLYSNLFRNCIYLFYLKRENVKLSTQVHDDIDNVILECLKMKAPKIQTKSYQLMLEKEKEEYLTFVKENEDEFGKISFDHFYFSKIVQNKCTNLDENEEIMSERFHEYLRRCYLIEKFYLCDNSDVNDIFIDWEYFMDVNNLYHHFYHKKLTDKNKSELPVYRGIDLPRNFLELIYPPFNISFDNLDKNSFMCLFSGAISNDNTFLRSRLPKYGMPFTVALNLSGLSISSLNFLVSNGYSSKRLSSIYVDKNGFQDPGFSRGDCLHLSVDKYNQLIDDFLSGDILTLEG